MQNIKNIISINDFSKNELLKILDLAEKFEEKPVQNILNGKVIATLFYEPSTRTRLSFESAANRLGAKVIGFSDSSTSSVKKGECLQDTIKTVNSYADIIVMRHPNDGAARLASECSNVPIVNAGDGVNQHPTQTLLDLYTIKKSQGKLNNITIAFVGDLKYGRTVHSLVEALLLFDNIKFYFVSPEELTMPKEILEELESKNIEFVVTKDLYEPMDEIDILYMTRIQRERFADLMEYEKVRNLYILKKNHLENSKSNLKILHPLPRVNEIDLEIDGDDKAYYFNQVQNGVYVREAILAILGGALE